MSKLEAKSAISKVIQHWAYTSNHLRKIQKITQKSHAAEYRSQKYLQAVQQTSNTGAQLHVQPFL